jgi:ribosome biogenesis GTPase
MRGIVLQGTGGVWVVRDESGETHEAALRGRLKQEREGEAPRKLAVGDEVVLERGTRDDAWAIAGILPRRSQLARLAPGQKLDERIVAANVDQVCVVFAAAEPDPHPRMLDRFLAIAEANHLAARVVINKVDLVGEDAARARFRTYERIGYPLHLTSVKTRGGLDELHAALHDTTSVLSGPSGVGKSSLMNALWPGLALRVGEISRSVNKGRHTTVGAFLHPLPDGGFVVDTPGLREIGLWGIPSDELDRCFREFAPFREGCRFGDCTHRVEPDCAVRSAVAEGTITAERHDSYVRLRAELEETEGRRW